MLTELEVCHEKKVGMRSSLTFNLCFINNQWPKVGDTGEG